MNNKALKEKAVMAVLLMVAAYALAVGLWFTYGQVQLKTSRKHYEDACKKYEKERALISERRKWIDAYEEEKANMPMIEAKKSTDTIWLPKIEEIAKKHYIYVSKRQGGKEISRDEVSELPLEIKEWEGSLESLVKFMHEVENTSEGMFDIKQLYFKPSSKKGYLKGSLTLTAAYMREDI